MACPIHAIERQTRVSSFDATLALPTLARVLPTPCRIPVAHLCRVANSQSGSELGIFENALASSQLKNKIVEQS